MSLKDAHTLKIKQWRGSYTLPLPEPCGDDTCLFCQNWYGPQHQRAVAYERRTAERAQAAPR